MTITTARQPKGVPTGGQFAQTTHGEADVSITPPPLTLVDRVVARDDVRKRMERLQEQADNLDRLNQAHSVQCAGALVLARFPGATTLRIAENVDGENQYDVISVQGRNDDGTVYDMEHIDDDDAFTYEVMSEPGPDLNELVWALNRKDDRWADGIATLSSDRYSGKQFDIDLVAAQDSTLPHIRDEHDPRTRSLSADEQDALVDAAYSGLSDLEDKLEERSYDYEPEDLRRMQEQLDTLNGVLKNTNTD